MKNVFILSTLLVFSITSFGQISPAVKFSVGYPYVLDEDDSQGTDFHTISTNVPTFSLEKPFPIEIRLKKRMSINPGVAWHLFKEESMWSSQGEDIEEDQIVKKDLRLNHQTFNGYVKVLYQAKLQGKTEAFMYGGAIGGMHFITNSKETKNINNLIDSNPETNLKINENAKDFFGMFYYGVLIGFQPNARKYNFIKPSFELAYYPGFITKTLEEVTNTKKNVSTIQLSVFLVFRIK